MPDAPTRKYKVIPLPIAKAEMRAVAERATKYADARRYLDSVVEAFKRLEVDPTTWGDPRKRYLHARLSQFHRLHDRISFVYAVDEERRIVYVRQCRPVQDHPLASG
jgi:hypothetical protein